ncbi:MAG: NHLP bacteriocin system secretion protein, partial [Cyanobacteria bacterium P01_A01_bin.83]
SQIVSQHSGKILELTVNQGQVIEAGTRLASINTDNQVNDLVGMTYFPVKDGKKVKPGMEIQITPQTVKRERFGGIVGTVTKVSPFPTTTEAAAKVVGSPEIIAGLVPETQPVVIQISASLEPDPETSSGFQWSSSSGPDLKMTAGTTTSARVKVSERAPITFVFPILRSLSGIY